MEARSAFNVCPLCNEGLHPHIVQQGGMHMECFNTEIPVYFVGLMDDQKNGYYEREVGNIADMIKYMDEGSGLIILKQTMLAGKYFNLPEFTGF